MLGATFASPFVPIARDGGRQPSAGAGWPLVDVLRLAGHEQLHLSYRLFCRSPATLPVVRVSASCQAAANTVRARATAQTLPKQELL
jgi:hypothetical protein